MILLDKPTAEPSTPHGPPRRPPHRLRRPAWRPRLAGLAGLALGLVSLLGAPPPRVGLIVEGGDTDRLETAIRRRGGTVTHRLPHISALGAVMPEEGLAGLSAEASVRRLWPAGRVRAAGARRPARTAASGAVPDTGRSRMVRADRLHREGITGRGITIAVVDGPPPVRPEILRAADGHRRLLAVYDAVGDRVESGAPAARWTGASGHLDQVLEGMLSSGRDRQGHYAGVAPNADLVVVSTLGADGVGSTLDVIRGIGWVIANRERYGIRVLNLSLAAAPADHREGRYRDEPLDRAVMAAWRAGIVVVAAAGNGGPAPATIAAPGDVPYVVTVGAAGIGPGAEAVPAYSAAGPTADGFVKPELVAPGGAVRLPTARSAGAPRRPAGGTSVAAAVVSGVAALVLEVDPWLSPDQLKHRLLAGARPATGPDGGLAYPILRQGAGLVDAVAAARSGSAAAANRGLDIERELEGGLQAGARVPGIELDLRPAGPDAGYLWSHGYAGLLHASGTSGGTARDWLELLGYAWSDRPRPLGYTWPDRPQARGYTWSDKPLTRGDTGSDGPAARGYTWSDRP